MLLAVAITRARQSSIPLSSPRSHWPKFLFISDPDQVPLDYVMVTVEIPENIPVQRATVEEALAASENPPFPAYLVPSVVVPQENNVVLFPQAPGFTATVVKVEPFKFDERLFTRKR